MRPELSDRDAAGAFRQRCGRSFQTEMRPELSDRDAAGGPLASLSFAVRGALSAFSTLYYVHLCYVFRPFGERSAPKGRRNILRTLYYVHYCLKGPLSCYAGCTSKAAPEGAKGPLGVSSSPLGSVAGHSEPFGQYIADPNEAQSVTLLSCAPLWGRKTPPPTRRLCVPLAGETRCPATQDGTPFSPLGIYCWPLWAPPTFMSESFGHILPKGLRSPKGTKRRQRALAVFGDGEKPWHIIFVGYILRTSLLRRLWSVPFGDGEKPEGPLWPLWGN